MGRPKSNPGMTKKEKRVHSVYQNRKNGLFKKVKELSVLCDVKACLIAFPPPKSDDSASIPQPETWPPDRSAVIEIIQEYRSHQRANKNKDRIIENPLHYDLPAKKLPSSTGAEQLDGLDAAELSKLNMELGNRLRDVRSWIQYLKGAERENPAVTPPMTQNHSDDMYRMKGMEENPLSRELQPMPLSYELEQIKLIEQHLMSESCSAYQGGSSDDGLNLVAEDFPFMQCNQSDATAPLHCYTPSIDMLCNQWNMASQCGGVIYSL